MTVELERRPLVAVHGCKSPGIHNHCARSQRDKFTRNHETLIRVLCSHSDKTTSRASYRRPSSSEMHMHAHKSDAACPTGSTGRRA